MDNVLNVRILTFWVESWLLYVTWFRLEMGYTDVKPYHDIAQDFLQ